MRLTRLSVSGELKSIPATNALVLSTLSVVESVTLSLTSALLSSSSETSGFPVLVDWVGNPVDSSISSDSLVLRVDTDDFKVLVDTILVDPVRVENTQVGGLSSYSFLGSSSQ